MALILVTHTSYFTDRPGGSSRIAYDLAHGLAAEGHRVWYLCQDVTSSKPAYEVDGRVTVLRYRLPAGRIHGLLFRHVHHMVTAQAVLRRHLPSPPDVIHGHAPFQYVAARRIYGRRGLWCYSVHSPVVEEMSIVWRNCGLTGYFKALLGGPLLQRMESEILRWSDVVVSLSEYTRSLLAQRHGSRLTTRVRVIPGWTDLDRFRPLAGSLAEVRSYLGWPVNCPVFFTLRRLESRMGLDNLLHAFSLARQAGHQFYAVIGGIGSQESALLDLRNRLGLGSCVSFMGTIPENILPLAYGACDVSVIPTAQLECFGLIALEALACGRPVLVTPVGALPEIIRNFEPRWIASSATPQGIADLICKYLDGALPVYDNTLMGRRLRYYSFARALQEYSQCLGLVQFPLNP